MKRCLYEDGRFVGIVAMAILFWIGPANGTGGGERPGRRPATGPLRVHPENPRYFTDGSGKAIYLTGAHTWCNLVDMGPSEPPPRFDFEAYLDFLEKHNHNFIRLWTWEPVSWDTPGNRQKKRHTVAPQPYARTGPGQARDGKPKFELTEYDTEYFRRLRGRVEAAGRRGIYVSVMLFEGWAMQFSPGAWGGHPFHPENNVNGIDGDADGDGNGLEIYTLKVPQVTAIQEAYVRHVIDTVNDLDNVLYEISNENHPPSTEWQYHMIRFIHAYERTRRKQHPVGMTFQYRGGSNETLFRSPAEWISPNPKGGYRDNPPPADGRKVILSDTDHLWGIGGNPGWVWKSFLRGLNPLFMDPYDGRVLRRGDDADWEQIRRALGFTLRYAQRVPLERMAPRGDLASSRYCLAEPGHHYLVYFPEGGTESVDLSDARGVLAVEWFDCGRGTARGAGQVPGGRRRTFTAPFEGHALLYLSKP
ncbi:MAG TPA: hypothetical protein EYP56_10215 [Planctomycetaceae bacterium]|nr:hypothetical protein [Planctomycetaceae bacterium]